MSSNSKGLYFIGSLLVLFLIFSYIGNFNLSKVATDSGFDTSYDSGGSSGGDIDSIFYLIYMFIEYPIPTIIIIILLFVFSPRPYKKYSKYDNNLNYQMIDTSHNEAQIKEILKASYQIFYEVQMSWMNFDYNRLRELVSDELYNMYYSELEMLKLKGHKNIMEGFKVNKISLVNTKEENGVIEYCINLNISFFDYIIDGNGKVVRGNKKDYHRMSYLLTVASSIRKIDLCPNCSAPLPDNSICDYCGSHIQGLREMRLVKKVNIKQERVE